jgi:RNA polymerase sigma-70 factor (ECF subfamily)
MAPTEAFDRVSETDRQLQDWMTAAQSGDRVAYRALLRACVPFVFAVARDQGLTSDAADDVVQETLLTLHRARHTYDPGRPFKAWLRTIARRRAVDWLRRQGRTRARETYSPIAYEQYPALDSWESTARATSGTVLGQALAALPSGQRQAVEHLALKEQSLLEASVATGRSKGALKVNLHRALKTLRARFAEKD